MDIGQYNVPRQTAVIWGKPAASTLAAQLSQMQSGRAFILSNRSLQGTALLSGLESALGNRLAGKYQEIAAHSPRHSVLAGAAAARAAGADVLVAVGGGSVVDAAKVIQACLWTNVTDEAGLDGLARGEWPSDFDKRQGPRIIAIPTTLSAAEFTPLAGISDTVRGVKDLFLHPLLVPDIVILDPAATLDTPDWLFTSTGIRAVDHCVATLCSTGRSPYGQAMARAALPMLSAGLRAVHAQPDDLDARCQALIGAWFAIAGPVSGVPVGASHAIGRVIGAAFGVAHGHTSCVLMPGTLRWNAEVDDGRQNEVSSLLGAAGKQASEVAAELIADLGLPGRLRDVGIQREAFPTIVKHSMVMLAHPATAGNQRPITKPEQVEEILDLCW